MSDNNKRTVQQLKESLFDLLVYENAITVHDFLILFIEKLRNHFSAEVITFFTHDDYNCSFKLEVSTKNDRYLSEVIIMSTDSVYEFLKTGNIFIKNSPSNQTVYLPLYLHDDTSKLISLELPNWYGEPVGGSWSDVALMCSNFIKKSYKVIQVKNEEEKYRQLYRVTSKFHSTMNMDDVLREVIQTLNKLYPNFTFFLHLSYDSNTLHGLPIKEIDYDDSDLAATEAFVTGEMQKEHFIEERMSTLYVALKGKQGIYGVLQINAPNTLSFPMEETDFITLLATTAGNALENANLYQQSNRLISDLKLINETSQQLNANLRLSEAMNFMSSQIIHSFGAIEVGFILVDIGKEIKRLPGSTSFFKTENSIGLIEYILKKIDIEQDAIFVGDISLDNENNEKKYRSLMAVPMIQNSNLLGVAIVVHTEAYYFSFETFKLLQALIHHSTLALTNTMLREELETLVVTDHLTKLHSRAYLNEKINESMRSDTFGTFLLIDFDDFKKVNDTFGHQVGDDILKQVATIIKENIRERDIGARWGGEELAIYFPNTTLATGIIVAERLVQKVEQLTKPKITISCGIGHWKKEQADNLNTLFKRADEALYHAKGTGKNKVCVQHSISLVDKKMKS